jgi:Tfp pilus assembly protein PilX
MISRLIKNQRGVATLIALIMMTMLTLIGLAALNTSDDEVSIAGNQLHEMQSFYAAEAGLDAASAMIQRNYDTVSTPPASMPQGTLSMNNCNVSFTTTDNGAATQQTLTSGTMSGLHSLVKSFTISSTGTSTTDNSKVELSQVFQVAFVPIFQFAVFYGNDLEIAPGPDMTLIGRVHSNGNLWLQSNNNLNMDSYVTSSGDIIHGRKGPGGVGTGDVRIKDASGNYVSMQESGGWLDANDTYWYDSSTSRWDGRVQDASHGQQELNLPLNTTGGDAHLLIERETNNPDSYEAKSTLKFINNQAYVKIGGVWSNVTADMTSKGIISYTANKFYDDRENKWVDALDLDVTKLYDNGYGPSNGVIYNSYSGSADFPALRLKNGAEVDFPLTVASQNPVYTQGNFNSINKKPVAIFGDAVTFLSTAWNDANSSLALSSRIANGTTVNASIMTGNVETTSSDYSGGFENLPRFLENWSGKTFGWKGSMVCLWTSEQAIASWNGTYYSPPNRNWQYDTDLNDPANLPPQSPVVRVFQRVGWKQENVSI